MPDPQRLSELRRQREMIAAHLRWLDEQISGEVRTSSGSTAQSSWSADPVAPTPLSPPISPIVSAASHQPVTRPALDPDSLLEELVEDDEVSGFQISKTGCWVIFATIMLVVCGLGVWAIYHFWG